MYIFQFADTSDTDNCIISILCVDLSKEDFFPCLDSLI